MKIKLELLKVLIFWHVTLFSLMTRMWNTLKSWVTTHALLLLLSRDVLQAGMVGFNVKFDENCQETSISVLLQSFITALLRGSSSETNTNPHYRQGTLTIGQLMAFNTTIRVRNQSSSAYQSRKRDPPVAVYVAQMIHFKAHNLNVISNTSKLGMCISQQRFIQLSAGMGNTVIDMNKKEGVVLPTNLRKGLFSTASVDNIDVATKSSSAVTSLHGTAASINQHMSSENQGQVRIL